MLSKRDNALIAYSHGIPEFVPCFYTDVCRFQAYPEGERYCGLNSGKDWFGVEWVYEPNVHAPMPVHGKELLHDILNWREVVKFPDLEAIDWKKQAATDIRTDFMGMIRGEGLVPYADGHSVLEVDGVRNCMVINGMFERLHAFMGFENALVALIMEPEECFEFFSAMADFKIAYFKKIVEHYPVDVINAHDDYGTNAGPMMSVALWRELIKPNLKRMVDACHEMGVLYQHHSCGFVEPFIPEMVDIGVDALDPLQSCNTNLPELKKKYGSKITFCGGFDNLGVLERPGVTVGEIKAEYRRVIDSLAPGGSYIVYPITATYEFVNALLEEHNSYGLNFYKNCNQ